MASPLTEPAGRVADAVVLIFGLAAITMLVRPGSKGPQLVADFSTALEHGLASAEGAQLTGPGQQVSGTTGASSSSSSAQRNAANRVAGGIGGAGGILSGLGVGGTPPFPLDPFAPIKVPIFGPGIKIPNPVSLIRKIPVIGNPICNFLGC